jgi:co-chaperonin GroES (HSP10)
VVEEISEGGIVIPQSQTEKEQMAMMEGQIIDWGDDAPKESRLKGIAKGDFIVYAKYAGQPKKGKDGYGYRLMRAADVMGKIDAPSIDLPAVRMPLDPAREFLLD